MRCFGDRLTSVANRYCRTTVDAEDAVQDALVNAALNLEQWRGEGRIESWLTTLVVNACARMRRGRKNNPLLHTTDVALPGGSDPEDTAAQEELSRFLQDGLLGLSPTARTIVLLSDVEGWKAPELAAHLGMTPGAVRSQLARARAALRQHVAAEASP